MELVAVSAVYPSIAEVPDSNDTIISSSFFSR